MSHAAELSIVVVGTNLLQVTACVESLAACAALDRVEIVLVKTVDCSSLEEKFPRLRTIAGKAEWSMPRLRAEGLRAVSRSWAAVLSEEYRVGADWAQAVLAEREQPDILVGEVLSPGAGYFAKAAYLWEYLQIAPPAAPGRLTRKQARWAPAGAVAYRTVKLDTCLIANAHSEMEYHQAMFDCGRRFFRDPGVRVRYAPPGRGFLFDRRRRSCQWARSRSESLSAPLRWLTGASRIALPAVLLGRFATRALARPRYALRALAALPAALLFAVAETLGEIEGYFGRSA